MTTATNRSRARLNVSSGTVVLFFASFLTHDAGELLHSVVSLVFTAVLVVHLRNNWRVYSLSVRKLREKMQPRVVFDSAQLVLAIFVTISGLAFWIGGDAWELGHEAMGGLITAVGAAHIFLHRKSLMRLVRRR